MRSSIKKQVELLLLNAPYLLLLQLCTRDGNIFNSLCIRIYINICLLVNVSYYIADAISVDPNIFGIYGIYLQRIFMP